MPNTETFHFEIRDLIAQFEDFLNGVIIRRYNNQREIQDKIKVSLVWGHKQRVLHDIVNRQAHIELPVIAVTMGGVKRDKTRVFNKIDGSYIDVSSAIQFETIENIRLSEIADTALRHLRRQYETDKRPIDNGLYNLAKSS